jgi:CelD/BcsL family acetyltransferase involved in cellulose biosynthesis
MLRDMLGAKKLKELRRQRNRLADDGEVTFSVARTPDSVARALDEFLRLEKSGWKGERGTALAEDAGDTDFVREAMRSLSESGRAEIATLSRGGVAVAAGLVLRHGRRAYFFKIGHDASAAKTSPGVQLTLDLTRHLCADPDIDDVDSTADADHPMIDHIWSGRSDIADLLLPTSRNAFAFECSAAAIVGRHATRDLARRAVNLIRSR